MSSPAKTGIAETSSIAEATENGKDEKSSIPSKSAEAAAEFLVSLRNPPKQRKPMATGKVIRPPSNQSLKPPPKYHNTVSTKQKDSRTPPKEGKPRVSATNKISTKRKDSRTPQKEGKPRASATNKVSTKRKKTLTPPKQGKSRASATNKATRSPANKSMKPPPKKNNTVSTKRKGSQKKTGDDESNKATKSKKARTVNSKKPHDDNDDDGHVDDDDETKDDDIYDDNGFPTKKQVFELAIKASKNICGGINPARVEVPMDSDDDSDDDDDEDGKKKYRKNKSGAHERNTILPPEEATYHIHRILRRTIESFHLGPSEDDKNMEQLIALRLKRSDPSVLLRLLNRTICDICRDNLGMYFGARQVVDTKTTYIYTMCPHCYKYLDIGLDQWDTTKAEKTFRIKGFKEKLERTVPTRATNYRNQRQIRCRDLTDALYRHFGGVCAMHLAIVDLEVKKPMRHSMWTMDFPRFNYKRYGTEYIRNYGVYETHYGMYGRRVSGDCTIS